MLNTLSMYVTRSVILTRTEEKSSVSPLLITSATSAMGGTWVAADWVGVHEDFGFGCRRKSAGGDVKGTTE